MSDPAETRLERLARLSTAIVAGDWEALSACRRAAPPGEPDRGWREAVLQSSLFAGFPRVVEALEVLASAGGLGAPDPEEALPESRRAARGAALFERIYGAQAGDVRAVLRGRSPELARWIEEHAYGRVLAREGLDAGERECLAVACLALLGQERQLASHVRGALRCGAGPAELRAALDAAADLIGAERLAAARAVADAFAPDGGSGSSGGSGDSGPGTEPS